MKNTARDLLDKLEKNFDFSSYRELCLRLSEIDELSALGEFPKKLIKIIKNDLFVYERTGDFIGLSNPDLVADKLKLLISSWGEKFLDYKRLEDERFQVEIESFLNACIIKIKEFHMGCVKFIKFSAIPNDNGDIDFVMWIMSDDEFERIWGENVREVESLVAKMEANKERERSSRHRVLQTKLESRKRLIDGAQESILMQEDGAEICRQGFLYAEDVTLRLPRSELLYRLWPMFKNDVERFGVIAREQGIAFETIVIEKPFDLIICESKLERELFVV